MWDYFISGIPAAFQLQNLFAAFSGTLLGIFFGALPGIGPPLAIALLLPLIFGMSPITALFLIMGVYNGSVYGGSITAILINTPGTAGSAATVLDGYPLSKQGKAATALGASAFASFVGGIVSALFFILFAYPLAGLTLKFGPAQIFLIVLFSLATVSKLSTDSLAKGLASTGFGLLLAFIGTDLISGYPRFNFGTMFLEDGLDLLVVFIGWFALAEVMFLVKSKKHTISESGVIKGSVWEGIRETIKHPRTLFNASMIGSFFGAVPGVGVAIANFLAYTNAKSISKKPELFGHGSIEGVIAPEAANNAVTGTSLIPTLVLGIPGNPTTAVMLGALMILGMQPGMALFTARADVMSAFMVGLIITNIMLLLAALLTMRFYQQITKVNITVLVPIIVVICFLGALSSRSSLYDLPIAIVLGILAYGLRKANYSIVCMVLGFVLANTLETNYHRAMTISNYKLSIFFESQLNIVIIVAGALLFLWTPLRKIISKLFKKSTDPVPNETNGSEKVRE
jgi:putative tricarboxylic transport membrane protein